MLWRTVLTEITEITYYSDTCGETTNTNTSVYVPSQWTTIVTLSHKSLFGRTNETHRCHELQGVGEGTLP